MSTTGIVVTVVCAVGLLLFFVFDVLLPRLKRRSQVSSEVETGPRSIASAEPTAPAVDGETVLVRAEDADQEVEEPEEDEPDMTWQQLVEQGDQQLARFEYDDALGSYEEARDKAREENGRDSLAVAEILVKMGVAYQARDDGEDDEDYFTWCYGRALAIMEQHLGPYDKRLLPVLQRLIGAEDQNGNQTEAETLIRRYELIEQAPAELTALAATPATVAAEAKEFAEEGDKELADNRDHGSAADSYWSGLESACEKHGNDSLAAAELWTRYGQAVQARDDQDDDEDASTPNSYMRALAILEQRLGLSDEKLVPVLRNLISFYDQVSEYGKADAYIRRLDVIYRRKRAAEQQPASGSAA